MKHVKKKKLNRQEAFNFERCNQFSIRKLTIGVVSLAIGASMVLQNIPEVEAGVDVWTKTGEKITDHNGLTQENIGTIQYARGATPQKYSNFDTFRTTWTFEEVIEDGQKVHYVNVKHVFNEARDNYGRHFVVFNIPDSLYEPSAIVRKTYGNANNTTPTEVRNFTTWIQDPGSSASRWAESKRYVRINPDGHAGNVENGTVGTKQVGPNSITDRISIESNRWAHDWTRIDWRYQTDGNGVLDTSNVYNELIKNKSRSIYVDDRALSDHMVTYEYRARVKDYNAPMNHLLGYNQPAGGWNNYGAVFGTTPDNRPFKERFPLTPPQRTIVDNLESLTEADKTAIKEKIKAANSSLFDNSNSTGKPVIASVANIEVPTNTTNGSKVVVTYTDGSKAELDAASVVTKKVVTPPPTTTTTAPIGNSTLKYKAENNGSGVNPNGNTPNTAISPVTEQWLNGWPGYPFSLPNGDQKSQMTRIQLREKTPVDMSTINNASSESIWNAKLNEVKADNKIGGSGTYPTGTVINGYGTHDANDNITYDMSVANQSTATIKKNSQGQIEGILIRGPRYDGQGVADAGLLTADMLFKQAPAADPLPGLKDQAKAEIDKLGLSTADKDRFKQAVQNATDQAGIEKALADAKKAAADLANAKTAAKAEIDKLNYLTPEQKTNFKNAIDGLQSTGDITNKVNEAKAQDLANAKASGTATVSGLENLSNEDKTAFNNRIAQATSPEDVQKIVEEATAKDADIEAARLAEAQKQAAKDAIDSIPGLTDEQKADFKNQIDQATDPRTIDTIVDTAKGTAQAETAKGQIEDLPYLNTAQKEALKAAIDADKSLYNIEATLAEARELNNSMKYLQDLVTQADGIKPTAQYTGATPETQAAFDQALTAAKTVSPVTGQNADKQAVDALIESLKAGISGLKATPVEQQVNKDALRAEHGLGDQVKASGKYTGADEALKRAYDDALTKANEVLANPSATQAEVDLALEQLIQAKHALNGSDIMTDTTAPVISSPVVSPWSNVAVHGASTIGKKVAKPGVTATEADYGKGTTGLVELIVTDPESGVDVNSVQFTESTQNKLRALGLEYVKYDQQQANGAIGYFTTTGDGIVKDTGTENVDLHFTVANTDGVRSAQQTFIYTIKDDIAPTATATEHILIKGKAYDLSIPFQDNSLFGREGGVTTGTISIKPEGNSPSEPLTPQALGVTNGTTASAFTLALTNPTPFSLGSENRGDRSNQGTISFAGTPTATLARTTYKLRLGDNNAPAGSSENVGYNDITFTVVDRLQALSDTEKVSVNNPQSLTQAEKTAIINAVKAKNPQIEQTNATVAVSDTGQVTVTYPHGNRTDTLTAAEVLKENPAPVFDTFGVDTTLNNQTYKTIFVFGAKKVNNAITENAPDFVPENATVAIPVTDNTGISSLQLWKFSEDGAATDTGIAFNPDGKLVSAFADNASNLKVQSPDTGTWHHRIKATDTGNPANSSISQQFRIVAYRDDVTNTDPIQKAFGQAVTQQELEAKLGINVRSGVTVPTTDYTRKVVGYTPEGGEYKAVTDISQLPTSGNYTVKVETTNIYGQTIANNIAVDYNEQTDIITPVAPAADKPALIDNATVTSQEDKNAVIDALKAANPNVFPDGTSFEVAPDGSVTVTYPDKSTDTVQVPIKQKDAAKHTPTATEILIESSTATGTTLTSAEREAVKNAVTLPDGASGEVTVPENASVQVGTDANAGKPVVLATVTYSDGTSETVEVPVKQKDTAKFTATVTDENTPALITSSDAVNTPITNKADKDTIIAKVTVPPVNGQEASISSKEITSPVKEVDGKKVVEVTVTYADGTVDKVNVPVDQKDSEANNPTVKDPSKPALISVSATENTPVTTEEDKKAITDKVNVEGLPNKPTSVVVPEGAKVTIVEGNPVVPVTVTYPDGTTDTVNVPVKQADAAKHTPTATEILIESSTATGTTLTSAEREAVKNAVTLPQGATGTVTVPENASVQEGTGANVGKPVVLATVTYSDGTSETVEVPVKQKDAAKYTPTATATPIDSLTAPGTVITSAERDAIKNAVSLPDGASGEVTVPDDASVQIGTGANAGKPVVPVTVTYQDGTSERIEVPVKQKDTAKFTATVTDENTPALITSSDAVNTPITNKADKDTIIAKVTVPPVNGQEASISSKEITSPVKEVDGKKVVEVTVTYADGTVDKVNVPVDQKDSEANNPTVKDPSQPALISVPAAENTPVTTEADKKAITDKVNVEGLPNTPTSVVVPEGAKVTIVDGKPVVPVTVTYPDGTTDTINVPVKQADTATFTATVTDENTPALISSSDAVNTPITNQADKDAIIAKVTVPPVNGQEATITSKEVTSPVKEVDGKKVVEVTVTYADGTVDKVNVPVDQKDSEANNPTVKDPSQPALISVPATENTPVTTEADKKAITDKVNVEGLPNTPTSVVVPEGAKVVIVDGKPVVPVTVTYPDGTTDTINVPVKQADNQVSEPSLKPAEAGQPSEALISVPVTADTPITSQADKDAIIAKVDTSNLPAGTTVTVPEGAKVVIVDGKPVVPVTVTYPDGTTDTINVPVKQADNQVSEPSLKPAEAGQPAEALISVPATADTPITSQADKDAIIAKVDTSNLPEGTTVTVPEGAKVVIVDGKPVVPVTVTYPDGTTDTINVPVKQADNQVSEPSLKPVEAGQPAEALISVPVTADTPITSQADKDAIIAKVDTSNLPGGTTVTVPEGAKVVIVDGKPVVPVTVTYPDGTTDTINVPVKQADNQASEPSLKPAEEGKGNEALISVKPEEGTAITNPADKQSILDKVIVPDGATPSIADDAKVTIVDGKPVVPVTVTYPDGTTDTINVPVKQADNQVSEPSLKPVEAGQPAEALISVPVTADTPITSQADKDAIIAKVDTSNLPAGTTVTVPEGAKVVIVDGKPVVPVTVTYPDGTTDTINVPVKQADTVTFTAIVTDETKPAVITSSDAVGTSITDQADKDAILAKVTVPAVDGKEAPIASKEITSPVKEVDGKKVVEVTVTYADGTVDKVNVPVDQKDSEANNPTVETPVEVKNPDQLTDAEKKGVEEAVRKDNTLPEGTTVEVSDKGEVTITYPDGSKDNLPSTVTTTPAVDSDKDGFTDKEETAAGTDATDPASTPTTGTSADRLDPTVETPVEVKNPEQLTEEEKKAVEDTVRKDNELPDGTKVEVSDKGEVTITYPDGSKDTLPNTVTTTPAVDSDKDGFTDKEETAAGTDATDPASTPTTGTSADRLDPTVETPVEVKNPEQLTEEEKKAVEDTVRKDNELPDGTKVEVSDKGEVTITYPDGSKDTLPNTVTTTPAVDSDKDGFTDKEETAAGTDATDPASTPATGTSADRLEPTVETPVEVKNPDQLTEEEKKAVEDTVRKDNELPDGTKVEVSDKGEVTITYPDGSKDTLPNTVTTTPAVDSDKDGFTDKEETAAGTDATDPASTPTTGTSADRLDPTVETPVEVKNPDQLTDDEKKAVEEAVRKDNELPDGTKVEVSDKGEVTITYPDGSKDTLPSTVTTSPAVDSDKDGFTDKEEAAAGTDATNPASTPATGTSADRLDPTVETPVEVKNPEQLTEEEKKAVEEAVRKDNDLPDGTKVEVSDKGEVTITYPDGSKDTLPSTVTTSPAVDSDKDGFTDKEEAAAGTDATDPASTPATGTSADRLDPTVETPVEVKNPDQLTDAEKKAVEDTVRKDNDLPDGTKVEVSDKGEVTITYPDGSKDTLPSTVTTSPAVDSDKDGFTDKEEVAAGTDATDPASTPSTGTSADRLDPTVETPVEVKNPDQLTDAEKKGVEEAVRKDNTLPEGTTVEVSDKGEVTITYPDGSKDTLPNTVTTTPAVDSDKDGFTDKEETAAGTDATDPASTPTTGTSADRLDPTVETPVEVKNPDQLTDDEKKAVEEAVRKDNELPDGTKVEVSDKGEVTITYPDGSKDTLPSTVTTSPAVDSDKDGFTDKEETAAGTDATDPASTPATGTSADRLDPTVETPVEVKNPDQLTEEEKKAVEDTVRKDNDLPDGTKVEVSDKGEVTITYPDGSKDTLPSTVTTSPAVDSDKDGFTDKEEAAAGTDATDPASTPATGTSADRLDPTVETPVEVKNPDQLTEEEKKAVEDTVRKDNDLPDGTKVEVSDKGEVTITYPDGSKDTLPSTVTTTPAVPVTPTAPVAPGLTTTANGDVLITPPAENVTSLEITFTPEGSDSPVTVVATKDANGTWTVPADSGLVVNPDGTITIPADKVKDGSAVSVVAKNGQVTSQEIASAVVPVQPTIPELPVAPVTPGVTTTANGDVLITPPAENVTSLEITFTPEGSEIPVTVVATKDANGNWTVPADSGLVVNPDGTIIIPASLVKDGTAVSVVAKNGQVASAEVGSTVVPDNQPLPELPVVPEKPVVTIGEDGSVTVIPPVENVTDLEITYTPEGSEIPITVIVSKDVNGNWTVPADSGLVVNPDGTITIPADKVKDGTEGQVTVVAKNGELTSEDAVPQMPVAPGQPVVVTNGDGSVTIVPPAEHVTSLEITFTPEGSTSPITVTLVKDEAGNWLVPAGSGLVINPDGSITIPADLVKDGTAVSVVAKNGSLVSGQAGVAYVPETTVLPETPSETAPVAPGVTTTTTGDVLITPPAENVTSLEITFTPEGSDSPITVVVTKDPNGNWSVPSGSGLVVNADGTITIPADKVKDGSSVSVIAKNGQVPSGQAGTVLVPSSSVADKITPVITDSVTVADPANLTDVEKKAVEDAVRKDNNLPEGTKVEVANDGTVTITYPDGSVDTISGTVTVIVTKHGDGASNTLPTFDLSADEDKDGFTNEEELKQGSNPADPKSVPTGQTTAERLTPSIKEVVDIKDPANLTDVEKKAVEDAVRKDNILPEGTKVEVAKDGTVTITYPDGSVDTMSVISNNSTTTEDTNSGTIKTVIPGSSSTRTSSGGGILPRTGEESSDALIAISATALLGSFALTAKRRRRED